MLKFKILLCIYPCYCCCFVIGYIYEPRHDKTNKMSAPSEDSDQPGHLPSLIRVFAVHMKKHWVLRYPLSAQQGLIRLGGCPGWSMSLLGAQSLWWFCHVVAIFQVAVGCRTLADAWQISAVKENFWTGRSGQTVPKGSVRSRSTLFAILSASCGCITPW